MKTSNELGHSNQVANFNTLISLVKQSGNLYNPSHAKMQIAEMEKLHEESANLLKEMVDKQAHLTVLISAKAKAFDDLPKYITRIYRTVEICDVDKGVLEDVHAIVKQFRYKSTNSNKKIDNTTGSSANTESKSDGRGKKSINSKNQLESLNRLIELIGEIDAYESNEEDLKLSGIEKHYDALNTMQIEVEGVKLELEVLRMKRDKMLYLDTYSLFQLAKKVKLYMKSIYKADSHEVKQVSALKFKSPLKAA